MAPNYRVYVNELRFEILNTFQTVAQFTLEDPD